MSTCADCRFFDAFQYKGERPAGFCRHHAPQVHAVDGYAMFPTVYHDEWCGDFKEQKITKEESNPHG